LWIEIKPAGFNPPVPGGSEQIAMDLVEAVFESYNAIPDRYEWSGQGGFSEPGTYQVFYFAKDSQSANVSPLKQTTVYKAKTDNLPPDAFLLISPQQGATELTTLVLDWQTAVDPDGDPLTYTVLLCRRVHIGHRQPGDRAGRGACRKELRIALPGRRLRRRRH
jgi:hypothetical protein